MTAKNGIDKSAVYTASELFNQSGVKPKISEVTRFLCPDSPAAIHGPNRYYKAVQNIVTSMAGVDIIKERTPRGLALTVIGNQPVIKRNKATNKIKKRGTKRFWNYL